MELRRGTTPTIEIGIPEDINVADSQALFITISQNKMPIIDKSLADVLINDNKVTVDLSQEETLRLTAKTNATVQIRFVLSTGRAFASQIKKVEVDDILKEGKI